MPNRTNMHGTPMNGLRHGRTRTDTRSHVLSRDGTSDQASSRSDSGQDDHIDVVESVLPTLAKPRSNGGAATLPDATIERAASTQAQYAGRFRQLQARFERERGLTASAGPEAFVVWLLARMSALRPASRRQYRAAVRIELHRAYEANPDPTDCARIAAALARLNEPLPTTETAALPRAATSALKMKRLTDETLASLNAVLAKRRGRYDAALTAYLHAGCLTGLRPCEWRRARLVLEPNRAVLVVRNAKTSHDRGHGPFRRLVWDDPAAPEVAAIGQWLSCLRGPQGRLRREPAAFAVFVRALRDRIRQVTQALWPNRRRRPTLYTARHAFAAMAKCLYGTVEVAALMGHAHDATAQSHYARPPRGAGSHLPRAALPQPHPRDVARVRSVYSERRSFLDARTQVGHGPHR